MFQGILQLCNPPEFHKDSIDLESGGKGGRAEAQQRCRRIGDGKFGRKREIQQGSHSPAREPGHFSLRGDSGSICACLQACDQPPPPPQFAAERCRLFRRSQSEPGAWSGRPASIGFLPHAGCLWTSPCPVCSVSGCDSPSYLSRRSRVCEARLPRLLQSALECCSSQEF